MYLDYQIHLIRRRPSYETLGQRLDDQSQQISLQYEKVRERARYVHCMLVVKEVTLSLALQE